MLIFSQSTRMLDIIERVLSPRKLLRIDGSTKEKNRQKNVDKFNEKNSDIVAMILSTKAAGLGITLTGADRAIVYDPSWNPADDAQAVDRCYRIGQTKSVTVYRLIAAGTVEERMYEKQVHKDGLKHTVLSNDGRTTRRYFDKTELRILFKLSPEGYCGMLEKINQNIDANKGGSGKPSFLGSHPSVVGISSHDDIYNEAVIELDDFSVHEEDQNKTPFASYTKSRTIMSDVSNLSQMGFLPGSKEQVHMIPLGNGKNKTRQMRELAKEQKHIFNFGECGDNDKENIAPIPFSFKRRQTIVQNADILVQDGNLEGAAGLLLDLVDTNNLKADEKLKIHTKIAIITRRLGWI
eukprot:CAMPEP_0171317198 /NCGR_PEP_ID=MMETSP0816-20121228/78873_1 /TAXON_ID=420281 /ORGANISM="Proboscia inermis, Strain CCAP1064/1" /LENGTH=350 /DNA_ID=CAMNT_0011810173 /DNA_START=249 /DNA_END=1301 /DNA_ORIENTATION=-